MVVGLTGRRLLPRSGRLFLSATVFELRPTAGDDDGRHHGEQGHHSGCDGQCPARTDTFEEVSGSERAE